LHDHCRWTTARPAAVTSNDGGHYNLSNRPKSTSHCRTAPPLALAWQQTTRSTPSRISSLFESSASTTHLRCLCCSCMCTCVRCEIHHPVSVRLVLLIPSRLGSLLLNSIRPSQAPAALTYQQPEPLPACGRSVPDFSAGRLDCRITTQAIGAWGLSDLAKTSEGHRVHRHQPKP
jgi:hypothetical protein